MNTMGAGMIHLRENTERDLRQTSDDHLPHIHTRGDRKGEGGLCQWVLPENVQNDRSWPGRVVRSSGLLQLSFLSLSVLRRCLMASSHCPMTISLRLAYFPHLLTRPECHLQACDPQCVSHSAYSPSSAGLVFIDSPSFVSLPIPVCTVLAKAVHTPQPDNQQPLVSQPSPPLQRSHHTGKLKSP